MKEPSIDFSHEFFAALADAALTRYSEKDEDYKILSNKLNEALSNIRAFLNDGGEFTSANKLLNQKLKLYLENIAEINRLELSIVYIDGVISCMHFLSQMGYLKKE